MLGLIDTILHIKIKINFCAYYLFNRPERWSLKKDYLSIICKRELYNILIRRQSAKNPKGGIAVSIWYLSSYYMI